MIHRKTSRLQAVLGRFFLPALALGMLGLPGSAGGSPRPGPGTNNNGDDPLACPGDEVDSLPVVTAPTGLTLIGQPFEIRGVVLAIQGRGQTVVQQLAGGRVAVTLCGDFRVDFDRRALAHTNVEFLFRGGELFEGGLASLSIAGSDPFSVPTERVPLPLSRLAGSGFSGLGVELHLVSTDRQRMSGGAFYRAERVVWMQAAR